MFAICSDHIIPTVYRTYNDCDVMRLRIWHEGLLLGSRRLCARVGLGLRDDEVVIQQTYQEMVLAEREMAGLRVRRGTVDRIVSRFHR